MTEKIIRDCAAEFAKELTKYATKLDLPSWRQPTITLTVGFSKESGPTLTLCFSGDSLNVEHTSLGLLMDEVYRRKMFDERAALSVQHESAALRSLTHTPTKDDEE